ncbi:hypothetical protein KL86SPO_30288 [uncultured Sporomusa sp.]|uniref:Uncharacterized protein n=1 Tax=uncultured Sporomusa sp. TaxID=307249 RepID=A0A212LRQ9_9FIRM|nr:hypothetical protein KL86SPO_30288 [uncultured Sporomusa sp.]
MLSYNLTFLTYFLNLGNFATGKSVKASNTAEVWLLVAKNMLFGGLVWNISLPV